MFILHTVNASGEMCNKDFHREIRKMLPVAENKEY
jgi:hypothetical protein